jgi:hypothetical protein
MCQQCSMDAHKAYAAFKAGPDVSDAFVKQFGINHAPYTPTRLESFTMAAMQGYLSHYGSLPYADTIGHSSIAESSVELAKYVIARLDQEQKK